MCLSCALAQLSFLVVTSFAVLLILLMYLCGSWHFLYLQGHVFSWLCLWSVASGAFCPLYLRAVCVQKAMPAACCFFFLCISFLVLYSADYRVVFWFSCTYIALLLSPFLVGCPVIHVQSLWFSLSIIRSDSILGVVIFCACCHSCTVYIFCFCLVCLVVGHWLVFILFPLLFGSVGCISVVFYAPYMFLISHVI